MALPSQVLFSFPDLIEHPLAVVLRMLDINPGIKHLPMGKIIPHVEKMFPHMEAPFLALLKY